MTKLTIDDTFTLLSGQKIPCLGFGVYESKPEVTQNSVSCALKAGYRHVDSAQYYENEGEVGRAVLASGVPREQVFVTTKIINPVNDSVEETYKSCKESVEKTGLKYLDLFLIHTPTSGPKGREIMWKALEKVQREGSTSGVKHIQGLIDLGGTVPSVNQIELHPFLQQPEITSFCQSKGISVEAYCPLTRGERFDDPTLSKIAEKHGKSTAQVLIRWSLQRGFVPLPKSDTPKRIEQNADIFDFVLSESEMSEINGLDEGKAIFANPVNVE